MVRASTMVAGLALAITASASPLPQTEDLVPPPPAETPAVDNTLPPEEPQGDAAAADLPEGISLSVVIENAQEAARNSDCSLDPQAPTSWAASGAEQMVIDYLKAKGPDAWINGLTTDVTGRNQGISCGHRNSGLCTPATLNEDCSNQDFFVARYLASSVKATFDAVGESLQDTGISGALNMKQIVQDFKLPEVPEGHDLGKSLNNVAFGVGVAEQAVGLIPGGEVISSFLALVGIGLNAASENMKDDEPEVPDYDQIEAGMGKYLGSFLLKTRDELDKMLESLFGEIGGKGTDEPLLRSMIERMGKLGVRELNKDAESPIAEIFKGGEWLAPIGKNGFKEAFDRGFKGMQGAVIGNLLSGLQVYVEHEENPPEGGPTACSALGELMIDNECYVVKRKGFNGEAPIRLEDEYLNKLGEYGIDIHTLIRSAKDCDNGEASNEFTGTGEYGRCWYGLNIATRVSDELVRRYQPGMANGFQCPAKYRQLDKIPSWIVDEKDNRCNGNWREVPVYQRCTLKMFNDGNFNDRGLARYRMRIEGVNIDVGQICPYLHDGRRCVAGSNRHCVQDGNGYLMEISFAHGSIGNDDFNNCHNDLYKKFKEDNFCFDA